MSISIGKVTLGATATLIVAARADRHKLILQAEGTVFIGPAGVSGNTGFPIYPWLSIPEINSRAGTIEIGTSAAIYGMQYESSEVRYLEEYGDGKHGGNSISTYVLQGISGEGEGPVMLVAGQNPTRRQLFIARSGDGLNYISHDIAAVIDNSLRVGPTLIRTLLITDENLFRANERGYKILHTTDEVYTPSLIADETMYVMEVSD